MAGVWQQTTTSFLLWEKRIFIQTGWTVQDDVYNVAGNLILNKDSKRDYFLSSLNELKQEVSALKSLPADTEQQ